MLLAAHAAMQVPVRLAQQSPLVTTTISTGSSTGSSNGRSCHAGSQKSTCVVRGWSGKQVG